CLGAFGFYGGRTYRRQREAERVAQEERLSALERLAESERLRLRAERERAEMERLVLVGQLVSGVAHEVNNPLAFVKSNLHYLERELLKEDGLPDKAELRELMAETRQGVLRIQQIVTDLRRFAREGDVAAEQGWPAEAIEEARRMASVRLRSLGEVVVEVTPGLPEVRLGQRYLVQVLVNLLLNAADAVEEAVPARRARIEVRARRVEGGVRLEVEDNGAGIAPEVFPRLFEPFFTTKPPGKGNGLGLALCHEYVTRAGGSLTAENRPEGGARFVLTLKQTLEVTSAAA
ncbi:MAG TPA: ATP-binding protein, partial [Archangium sp.]